MIHHKHLNVYAPESETERGPERSCNQHTRELINAQKASQKTQQRPESPTVTLIWHTSKKNTRYKISTRGCKPYQRLAFMLLNVHGGGMTY